MMHLIFNDIKIFDIYINECKSSLVSNMNYMIPFVL